MSLVILLLFIFLLELQLTDLWKEIDGMQTPELRHLAERLIGTVLKSRANATTKKYLGAYVRWQHWAVKNHTTSFPVAVPMFALYLQDVGDRSKSKHAVKEAINVVSWVQSLAGVEPVSQNQDQLMKGSKEFCPAQQ